MADTHGAPRDVVVAGASAGGVESLVELCGSLDPGTRAAVLVVLHLPAGGASGLTEILARACALPVHLAVNRQAVAFGGVCVAPADRHLELGDRVRLTHGPRENGYRPAIDVLFRTAAEAYGRRVMAVVLSGALSDGALGALAVKRAGGVVAVEEQPLFSGMVESAEQLLAVDLRARPREIAAAVSAVSTRPPPARDDASPEEARGMSVEPPQHAPSSPSDDASGLTCPECGGAIWVDADGPAMTLRCHVGHAYSPPAMLEEQRQSVERALWGAVRSVEERAGLYRRMALRAAERGDEAARERYAAQVLSSEAQADVLRAVLERDGDGGEDLA